ncbi:MAG: type I-G CRISPR-associated helicase/endonuclease Cas3g [Candidatus Tyrphobacter sp.]
MTTYKQFFQWATGKPPYPYQERLALGAPTVLHVPTGLGKTEATVLSWLYRRSLDPARTPRRLIYCLPMRSLVEQTRDRVKRCFERLANEGAGVAPVEVVMGSDVGEEWFRNPESPYVVVGTQDMLLSRALNRGYGMSRFQWPMTFAAVNDDACWVVDEVQIQGIGAVTATQLQAFRERFGTFHRTEITLASATVDESWFETADFSLNGRPRVSLDHRDLAQESVKLIVSAKKRLERGPAYDPKAAAALALERHQPGTRTLIVLNRVSRAQEVYRSLKRSSDGIEVVLLHSRFRPADRAMHTRQLLEPIDSTGAGRIVVATQVVEAGVDVSAATLITDVAPWASLVQRFGRCNRRGEDKDAACIWLDGGEVGKTEAPPYDSEDLTEARELLTRMEGASVAPADLPQLPIPFRGGLVIRKPEFFDLFDTSADLSGHDVDVSPYIRGADDISVSVFWRGAPPDDEDVPQVAELCLAPVSAVREIVKSLRSTRRGSEARVANQFSRDADNAWTELHDNEIRPGITVWFHSDVGWYDVHLGFGKVQARVTPAEHEPAGDLSESCPTTDSDRLSWIGIPITLTRHAQDTRRHAEKLAAPLALPTSAAAIIVAAALWHDTGKAHPVFQETMRRANVGIDDRTAIWAKAARPARHKRPGFRHELPGALAYLHAHPEGPANDVIAFLIAAHHGKMRLAAQQLPYEAPLEPFQLLGNRDGESLPSVDLGAGAVTQPIKISLASFRVGTTNSDRSWVDRVATLRDDTSYGPFRLAYLELLVRLADWRASADEQSP